MMLKGHCHCGAIEYEVAGTPQHVALCHCEDCRRSAGAPMVSWAAFAEDEFKVTKGEPKTFNSSGLAMRSFCGDCGSPTYLVVERALTTAYVFTGLLDQTSDLRPKVHGWTTTKHAWVEITEGGLQHDMDPGLAPR